MSDVILFTPKEAAKRMSISVATIYNLMKAGKLRSVKIGKSRRIPAEAIAEFVESLS